MGELRHACATSHGVWRVIVSANAFLACAHVCVCVCASLDESVCAPTPNPHTASSYSWLLYVPSVTLNLSSHSLTEGQWTHAALVFLNNTMTYYLNGVLAHQASCGGLPLNLNPETVRLGTHATLGK